MKAKIRFDVIHRHYEWLIYYDNGAVAAKSPYYTRRDNAIRGLRNFLDKIEYMNYMRDL